MDATAKLDNTNHRRTEWLPAGFEPVGDEGLSILRGCSRENWIEPGPYPL
jgi:hypothetical protein